MFFIPFNSYLLALSDSYPVVYVSPFHEGSAEETRGGWEEERVGGSRSRPICQDAALVSRDRVQMIKRGLGSIQ